MLIFGLVSLFASSNIYANDLPFQNREEFFFDIKYKYGIVMLKGGTAHMKMVDSYYQETPTFKTILDFKTTSFFDAIYEIRDTLSSHIAKEDLIPLFHNRSVNEGSTKYVEELYIRECSKEKSSARIVRKTSKGVKIDSVINVNGMGYDMLNMFAFIRTLDYDNMKVGDSFRLTIFIGKQKADVVGRFMGKQILDRSKKLKYNTLKFNFDVVDDVFEGSKNVLELWIGDDANKVPIKMKAKLKIGAAEAYLTTAKNLKYPFDAELRKGK